MSPASNRSLRVAIPYRTRKEELAGSAKLDPYLEAVRLAGAEPIAISLGLSDADLRRTYSTLDAVVLSGSPADVDPDRFHAEKHRETAAADPDRERTDFALIQHALDAKKPLLAICYGIQSLNVFLGGTLVQDIPSEIGETIQHDWEREKGDPETFHETQIEPQSALARLAGAPSAWVNSSHHQSIQEPGRNLKVVARSADGVIEGVEWTGDPATWILGVQWHPERLAVKNDPFANALFASLLEAAAARKVLERV